MCIRDRVKAGDTAVLIGRDGKEEISVYDVAKQVGTISNEILSRLGSRVVRRTDREEAKGAAPSADMSARD